MKKKKILFLISILLLIVPIKNYSQAKTNQSKTNSNNNELVNKKSFYKDFLTKSYFEKRNKIKLNDDNIDYELEQTIKADIILNNLNENINKKELYTLFKKDNIKLCSKLHLENLIDISVETILDKNNEKLIQFYSIDTNKKIKIIENNINISKEKAFDLNKNSVNQIVGNIKLDISQLDNEFKQIIKEYSDIYSKELNLNNDILQINIYTLTNEI